MKKYKNASAVKKSNPDPPVEQTVDGMMQSVALLPSRPSITFWVG